MCLKRFFTASLLVLFVFLSAGFTLAESTPPTYPELLIELTEIWKNLNTLSVSSEVRLIDMQERWPSLIKRVEDFGNKLTVFEKDQASMSENMKLFNQSFNSSVMELQVLKNQYAGVLLLVETLQTSFMNIEEEVKRMERRTNVGLVISIVAALLGAVTIGYTIYNGGE